MLDEGDLAGLPDFLRHAMSEAAASRGAPGRFAVTTSRSIMEPFLSFSQRRDLRETAFKAFIMRGQGGGATDNTRVVADTLRLRAEKAALLGFDTFAAYKLEDTMAKTPASVMELLEPVWEKALDRAAADQAQLEEIARDAGDNQDFAAWDWRFYAEKLRAKRFDFDEAALKPYLALDNVIAAAFDVANRLFGLTATEHRVAGWHEDVRVFELSMPMADAAAFSWPTTSTVRPSGPVRG